MRRSLLVGALLIGASSMSSAAEVHIDEHTLCLEALRAFDEKLFAHLTRRTCRRLTNFFGSCRASKMRLMRYPNQEEAAPSAKLTAPSIEVPIILGFCH